MIMNVEPSFGALPLVVVHARRVGVQGSSFMGQGAGAAYRMCETEILF